MNKGTEVRKPEECLEERPGAPGGPVVLWPQCGCGNCATAQNPSAEHPVPSQGSGPYLEPSKPCNTACDPIQHALKRSFWWNVVKKEDTGATVMVPVREDRAGDTGNRY